MLQDEPDLIVELVGCSVEGSIQPPPPPPHAHSILRHLPLLGDGGQPVNIPLELNGDVAFTVGYYGDLGLHLLVISFCKAKVPG